MPSNITINVPNYPASNRTPGVFFGIDPSNANTATPLLRTLIIGQVTAAAATANASALNVPVAATSLSQVQTLAGGAGAHLALTYQAYVGDDSFAAITLLPVADNAGGTAAVYTATVTGPATGSGTLPLYIAGQSVPVAVTSGDSVTVIAANIVAAIALNPSLPCTATASVGVVTLTARHKGIAAGDIDLRLAYRGAIAGEVMPAGVAVAFANSVPGATDPVLTTALANLSDTSYRFIVSPYSGSVSLTALESYLSDSTGTWSPLTNNGGHVFSAFKGTFSATSTYGLTNNNQHVSVLGLYDTPTSVSQMAGSFAGVCAASLRNDPSLPLKEITMQGILAPPVQSRFTRTMRNTLLYDGIATTKSNSANQVILERAVTTYQTNGLGSPDDSYLQTETLFQLQAVIDLWKGAFTSKYARVKLVDNGTVIIPGANMVNPNSIKAEVVAQYQIAANLGYVQNVATFAQNVNVQKTGAYSVNVYAPIQLSDQLFTIGVDLAFSH